MECNKTLKAMLALGIVMFIIAASAILTTNSLQKENAQLKDYNYKLLTARAECSPLGFCIGDKVEPTDYAKRWNITIGGVVRKIEGKLLTIDTGTPGNENWAAVDEAWVKHAYIVENWQKWVEARLKEKYPDKKLHFKWKTCTDTIGYSQEWYDDPTITTSNGRCYVRYSTEDETFFITFPVGD